MKKLLAFILTMVTCFTVVACGGSSKYDFVGEWEAIAYKDNYLNMSIAARPESVLGDLVTIEKEKITYVLDNATTINETQFIAEAKDEVYELQVYDTRYKTYGALAPFGESLMLWNGPSGSSISTILLRRNIYKENLDPISSLITGEGQDMVISIDALVGEYSSRLVKLNAGYNNCVAFSTKENENNVVISKDGDTIKFTEDKKTWTVKGVGLNVYLRGVEILLESGQDKMLITVMEVSEKAICYTLNSTVSGNEFLSNNARIYNYGVLVKQ